MGRITEYEAGFVERLLAFSDQPQSLLVRGQLSDARVGVLLGVSRESVRRWRRRVPGRLEDFRPEFAAAWDQVQDAVDAGAIKRSMIERATGFVQRKIIRAADDDGKMTIIREEKITLAGDVAAAKLVLGNIDASPQRWNTADKTDARHAVTVDGLTALMEEIDGHGRSLPAEQPVGA